MNTNNDIGVSTEVCSSVVDCKNMQVEEQSEEVINIFVRME